MVSWWFVEATQDGAVDALAAHGLTGSVAPGSPSPWTSVIVAEGGLDDLLPGHTQLWIGQLPTAIAVLGITRSGDRLSWSNTDRSGPALAALAEMIAACFGGEPALIARALLTASGDVDTVHFALRTLCRLPPAPGSGEHGSPVIGYAGSVDSARMVAKAAGPTLFVAGHDGWSFLLPNMGSSDQIGEYREGFDYFVQKGGAPAEIFTLVQLGGAVRVERIRGADSLGAVVVGPAWRHVGPAAERAAAAEDLLVGVVAEEQGMDPDAVREAFEAAKAAPRDAGLRDVLAVTGLPDEAYDVLTDAMDRTRTELFQRTDPVRSRVDAIDRRYFVPMRIMVAWAWGVLGVLLLIAGLLMTAAGLDELQSIGTMTMGLLLAGLGFFRQRELTRETPPAT